MSTFLIIATTSQSSSYPIVFTRLGGPRSSPNIQHKNARLNNLNECVTENFFFATWSSLPHSSHTEILIRHYNIIPSKSPLIFQAVNMTGKREDNSVIPFINLVKAHQ